MPTISHVWLIFGHIAALPLTVLAALFALASASDVYFDRPASATRTKDLFIPPVFWLAFCACVSVHIWLWTQW